MNEMEIKRTPEVIGAEIRSLTTQARNITLWYGIEIGRRLTEAKEMVNHGEWLPFLEQQTDFSQPTASRFMRLYKEYGADQSSLFGAESKYSSLNNLTTPKLPSHAVVLIKRKSIPPPAICVIAPVLKYEK